MLFNSYMFVLFFLPICLGGYFLWNRFHKTEFGKLWLIAMSLWFYAYFNHSYLMIILCSIAVNYFLYCLMERIKYSGRKMVAVTGVIINLGVLFYFKYYDFFLTNLNQVFRQDFMLQHILLPLGISFFTFQQIGFLVDAYRGEAEGYSLIDYALFVTFFPQLIAGPIVSHSEMIPQFQNLGKKQFEIDNFVKGLYGFTIGMAKKVLLADTLGIGVEWAFSNFGKVNGIGAVMMMLSYTLQLYFDFSGYCDMAVGIGNMFNISIPINFNSPYKALNIIDFWKRWHITLSRFFTRYVYIPLGGSRKGSARTYFNLFFIYFISGIWHGAGWTYIIWGTLHGVVYIITKSFGKTVEKIPKVISWVGNMGFFVFSLIFFRAESISQALDIIKTIFTDNYSIAKIPIEMAECYHMEELWYPMKTLGISNLPYGSYYLMFIMVILGWILVLACKNTNEKMEHMKPNVRTAIMSAGMLIWSILSFAGVSSFLYFNF